MRCGRAIAWWVFLTSHLVFACALAWTWRDLPERVASHFDGRGVPDGWSSRSGYVTTIALTGLGMSAFVLAVFVGMRWLPVSLINMPRRDYWLAPQRRRETLDYLMLWGVWLASLDILFMLALHLLTVAANRAEPVRLSAGAWWVGGLFVAALLAWVVALIVKFRRVPPT